MVRSGAKKWTSVFGFLIIFLLGLGSQSSAAVGHAVSPKNRTAAVCRDAHDFMTVGIRLVHAPFHFKKTEWVKTGAVAGTTALLFLADENIRRLALHHQNTTNDALFNVDQFYGNGITAAAVFGLYGAGYLFRNERMRLAGLHAAEAFTYAGTMTAALKILFGRRRPYAGKSNLFFRPFQIKDVYNSLPSGHTTVAFAVSTVMAKSGHNPYWKIFWYSMAGMVAASRIYHNRHWASDVFLGAAIGYAAGSFVMHF